MVAETELINSAFRPISLITPLRRGEVRRRNTSDGSMQARLPREGMVRMQIEVRQKCQKDAMGKCRAQTGVPIMAS